MYRSALCFTADAKSCIGSGKDCSVKFLKREREKQFI